MEFKPFLSMVVATVDRTKELDLFLKSLKAAPDVPFEIIIVDQNEDDRIAPIIASYKEIFSCNHIKVNKANASSSRNIGLKQAKGKWVCFPDDDCCYKPDTLLYLIKSIDTSGAKAILGTVTDFNGRPLGRFYRRKSFVSLYNMSGKINEPGMFFERELLENYNGFDEQFGPGATYPAAEGWELVVRLLKQKEKVFFNSSIQVLHENKFEEINEITLRKTFTYSYGFGCLLGKHFNVWSMWYLLNYNFKFLLKVVLYKNQQKKALIQSVRGLYSGVRTTLGNA